MKKPSNKIVSIILAVISLVSIVSICLSVNAANFYILQNKKGTLWGGESKEYSFTAPEDAYYILKIQDTDPDYDNCGLSIYSEDGQRVFYKESNETDKFSFRLTKGNYKLKISELDDWKKEYCINLYYNKHIETASIVLSNTSIVLKKGSSYTLPVKTEPYNSDDKITFKSDNTKIATVNSKGTITAKATGTANITITSGSKTKKCKVTVRDNVNQLKLFETAETISVGKNGKTMTHSAKLPTDGILTLNMKAYGSYDLEFSIEIRNSKNETVKKLNYHEIAEKCSKSFKFSLLKGNYTIILKTYNVYGIKYRMTSYFTPCSNTPTTEIKINKTKATLTIKDSISLLATAKPNYNTDTIKWKSSNPTVATVDKNGKIRAERFGTAIITATSGSKSVKCTVIVNNSKTLTLRKVLNIVVAVIL